MSGPGMGMLAGLAWAASLNERDYRVERARLERELASASAEAACAMATKDAAKAVLNAVISELKAEQQGRLKARSLSDPGNVAGRHEAFLETAEGQLRRLSKGRLSFCPQTMARARKDVGEVADILADRLRKPKAQRLP